MYVEPCYLLRPDCCSPIPKLNSMHQDKCSSEENPDLFIEEHILNCNDDGTPPVNLGSHIFGSITGGTYYIMIDGCMLFIWFTFLLYLLLLCSLLLLVETTCASSRAMPHSPTTTCSGMLLFYNTQIPPRLLDPLSSLQPLSTVALLFVPEVFAVVTRVAEHTGETFTIPVRFHRPATRQLSL
jgi:hypothetical protein